MQLAGESDLCAALFLSHLGQVGARSQEPKLHQSPALGHLLPSQVR